MTGSFGFVSALIVISFLGGACAEPSADVAPSGPQPLVIPRANAARATESGPSAEPDLMTPAQIADGLHRLQLAVEDGDYETALQVGDELLRRGVAGTDRDKVESARMNAKQHLMQSFYLDAVIRLDRTRVTVGESITGEVALLNLSPETLVIADEAEVASGGAPSNSRTLLRMETDYTEFGFDGTQVHDRLTQNTLIGEPVTLAPGKRHLIPIKIDTMDQNPSGISLKEYVVSGTLYMAQLKVGEELVPGNLVLKPTRVRVFPRNWEHLSQSPVTRLDEALKRRSPPHVPLAAALVAPESRRSALDVIRRAFDDQTKTGPDQATRVAACVALRILTGEDRRPEPSAWHDRLLELTN